MEFKNKETYKLFRALMSSNDYFCVTETCENIIDFEVSRQSKNLFMSFGNMGGNEGYKVVDVQMLHNLGTLLHGERFGSDIRKIKWEISYIDQSNETNLVYVNFYYKGI